MLHQSSSPQFPSPADGSLIASFQPVPPETLALLPRWHFAHALVQKAAAGVKAGLGGTQRRGCCILPFPSLPPAPIPLQMRGGPGEVGCLPPLQMDPGSSSLPCVATFFLHKDNLWDQVYPCGFPWWLWDDRKRKGRENECFTETFGWFIVAVDKC